MPHRITFGQQKGGTGKTTMTRELGIYLAVSGHHTLLIDTDPQGNLTKGLTDLQKRGTYEAYTEEAFDLHQIRDNLYLMHGSEKLAQLERNLIGEVDAYTRLKSILAGTLFKPFDYILIDTPPTLGVMTLNAFAASDYLAVVINPAVYTLQGTNTLMSTYTKIRENLNANLTLLGAFVNQVDPRPLIVREIMDELEKHFNNYLVTPPLSRSVKIEEAIPKQAGVVELGKSKVKDEIEAIGKEFIARTQR